MNEIKLQLEPLKTKKEKILALKNQLHIHKETMAVSSSNKHLFHFSTEGKHHNIETLTNNLLQLLKIRSEKMDLFQYPDSFVGKFITHVWTDDGSNTDTKYSGKIMSFNNDTFKVIALLDLTVHYLKTFSIILQSFLGV